jgi:hypothetical protein
MPKRKTVDCWRFFLNYGAGWEHEITEYTFADMRENRRAYRENCNYPLEIRRCRERATPELLAEIERSKARRAGSANHA